MSPMLKALLQKNSLAILCRNFHASSTMQKSHSKMMFNIAGYYKFGLLRDDLLSVYHKDVAEAIRRLPEEEQMNRIYRAIRAQHVEVSHSILSEDQWTKYEDNHFYLQPYLEEVIAEREEREEWEANH